MPPRKLTGLIQQNLRDGNGSPTPGGAVPNPGFLVLVQVHDAKMCSFFPAQWGCTVTPNLTKI